MRRRLTVGVILAVAFGLPLATHSLLRERRRGEAADLAADLAGALEQRAQRKPTLWRYDSAKWIDELRVFGASEHVRVVAVFDARGERVYPAALDPPPAAVVWAAAPVGSAEDPVGWVQVAADIADIQETGLVLVLVGAALGLGLVGLVLRLEQKERRIAELGRRAQALRERERRAIARDLHDSTGQALTAARINLELLRPHAPADLVDVSVELLDEAVEEVRRAVGQLSAPILDELDLPDALERLARDFQERTGIALRTRIDPGGVAADVETALYRIAQEALTNVARHAHASAVELTLEHTRDLSRLVVADDGVGIAPSAAAGAGHGLRGMADRALLLGGRVDVSSRPNGGTRVLVEVPTRPRWRKG